MVLRWMLDRVLRRPTGEVASGGEARMLDRLSERTPPVLFTRWSQDRVVGPADAAADRAARFAQRAARDSTYEGRHPIHMRRLI